MGLRTTAYFGGTRCGPVCAGLNDAYVIDAYALVVVALAAGSAYSLATANACGR